MVALNTSLAKSLRGKIPTQSNIFTSLGPHMYTGIQVLLFCWLVFLMCFSKCNINTGVFSFFMLFPVFNPMGCDVELLVKFVCFLWAWGGGGAGGGYLHFLRHC